ncbi:MAG: hypothetical protein MJ025_05075 [Victivallaceae bacterium]|nr:hypothetical protein [Victivallaceae bacterium]
MIQVPAGQLVRARKHITDLKTLDVKAGGTYSGAILETQAGKAKINIAANGLVKIDQLMPNPLGSQTTIAMKKNATLSVGDMEGITKLTTANNCVVKAETGHFIGTPGNDTISIGKANSVTIGGKLDFREGKNTLKVGANSNVYVLNEIVGVQTLTVAAGAKYKDDKGAKQQGRTYFVSYGLTGTEKKDKVSIGNFSRLIITGIKLLDGESSITIDGPGSVLQTFNYEVSGINTFKTGNGKDASADGAVVVKIGGKLSLNGAKKNTLAIGKFGTATIGSVDIDAKATVTIGANGTVTIGGDKLENIAKLTVAAGSKYKDAEKMQHQGCTIFDAGSATISGTTANDTLTFGSFGTAAMGTIDLGSGKNTLSIGGQDVEFKARDVKNVTALKVAAGKSGELNATVDLGDIEFNQVSNKLDIGAYASFDAGTVNVIDPTEKTKLSVNIGSAATESLASMENVSTLKVAAGRKDKTAGNIDRTDFGAKVIKGTDNNDTFAFADLVTADFDAIDMGGDTDKLTIGKESRVMAKDVRGVEIVTLGDGSTFGIGIGDIEGKITGSAKDNTLCFDAKGHVDEVDLGKGDDLISFTLDGTKLTEADSWTAIDKCSEVGLYKINGQEFRIGDDAIAIGNDLAASVELGDDFSLKVIISKTGQLA